MQILNFRFKPKLVPTLATLLVLPILINLGLWQSNKADTKQKLQDMYDMRAAVDLIHIGGELLSVDALRYSHVETRGYYEPAYQVLLDNQIYKGQAGYHVITPLHISGSNIRVLVNRGWVPVGADRNILPVIETPQSEVDISGIAFDPSGKYIELAHTPVDMKSWQTVWQNLDLAIYKKRVPFPLQPVTILMDATSSSGGYIRDWPKPNTGLEVNRGYAVQWYLMSIALVIIYIVTNFKKVPLEDSQNNGK